MIRIGVVQNLGAHSEREIILALEQAGMHAHFFSWDDSKEKLADFHGFILTDHFSSEDYLRASTIAALSPTMQRIKEQSLLGKPVLGIGKGAQILVEAGLVPGLEHNQVGIGLADNQSIQQGKISSPDFYNGTIHLRLSKGYQWNAFTRYLTPNDILHVPIAHAEGRFIIPPVLLAEIERNGLHVFQYCDENRNIVNEFPINPNGSIHNIAAIANKTGNVMAIIPHLDQASHNHAIFKSMREYIVDGYRPPLTLDYQPRALPIKKYHKPAAAYEWIIDVILPDHHVLSVENALNMPATIKRAIHWEIQCDSTAILEKIKSTGVLFTHKEKIIPLEKIKNTQHIIFLVRAKEDMIGHQKLEKIKNEFDLQGVQRIFCSTLWCVNVPEEKLEQIIRSNVFFNPYVHDCYYY